MIVSKWVRIGVQFSKSTLKAEVCQIKPRFRPEFYAASPTSTIRSRDYRHVLKFAVRRLFPARLSLLLVSLSQADPWATAVLVDEFDAGALKGAADR